MTVNVLYCLYFLPEVMVKLMKKVGVHFVKLIEISSIQHCAFMDISSLS